MSYAAAPGDADEEEAGLDAVIVTATRSGQLVRDQPVRVEVVPDEEIRESLTVAPGNLTNILNELAGVRMQSRSARPRRHSAAVSRAARATRADSFRRSAARRRADGFVQPDADTAGGSQPRRGDQGRGVCAVLARRRSPAC